MSKAFDNLEALEILEKNENSIKLAFLIPQTNPYFDGHFPGYPILPAVAQVDIVINFAVKHFGTSLAVSQIKRTKFTKIITPSLSLLLVIEKNNDALNFKYTSPDGNEMYSGGTIYPASSKENK